MGLAFFRYQAEEEGTERLTFTATLYNSRTGSPVTLRSALTFRIRECNFWVWVHGEWFLPGYGDRNSHGLNHVVLDSVFGLARNREGRIEGIGELVGTEEWYDLNGEVQQDRGSVFIGGDVSQSSNGLTLRLRVPGILRIPISGNTYTPFSQAVTVLSFPPELRRLSWPETEGVGRAELIVMLIGHRRN
jgi:hypothetical protein